MQECKKKRLFATRVRWPWIHNCLMYIDQLFIKYSYNPLCGFNNVLLENKGNVPLTKGSNSISNNNFQKNQCKWFSFFIFLFLKK